MELNSRNSLYFNTFELCLHLEDEVFINELIDILLEYKMKIHIHHFYRDLSKMTNIKLFKYLIESNKSE